MITGGTGSYGNMLTEILLEEHKPEQIVIYSRGEHKQGEMQRKFGDLNIMRYFIGDVRDLDRLKLAMHGVDYVFHAAALKVVPTCEYNPSEAVQTNVIGTQNVITACLDTGVKRALYIGTDKAVAPINLYGATKLCAEKLFIAANQYAGKEGTIFGCLRYGNVINSNGSVVPLFKKQKETGCITITDKQMTRFMIQLEEAVRFSVKALEDMYGGEVFIPKIPSVYILEVAKAIAPDCKIKEIGIRPGEKLHEMLFSREESRRVVDDGDRYIMVPDKYPTGNYKGFKPKNGQNWQLFDYSSDGNKDWLCEEDIKKLME